MGNEMGGLEVSLFADLMYNDLNGIVHTGKIDQSTLSAYLYTPHFCRLTEEYVSISISKFFIVPPKSSRR